MSTVYFRFSARQPGVLVRAPLLEELLARASVAEVHDWRREAFSRLAGSGTSLPSVAAVALQAAVADSVDSGASADVACLAWVCVAAPVHFVAGMTNVTLSAGGLLNLNLSEAQRLAVDFNRVFSGSGMRLMVGRAGVLLCVFDRPIDVVLRDPEDLMGHDIYGFQPVGADAARVRGAMCEFEMWLHDHEVNRLRVAQGQPPITGLWLWGGGAILSAPVTVRGWTGGHDPMFGAFGDQHAFPGREVAMAPPGPGVVVTTEHPGSEGWMDVELRWLAPAAAALRAGAMETLELSTGARRYRVDSGRRWRFWRRARPWWETLEGSESNGSQ